MLFCEVKCKKAATSHSRQRRRAAYEGPHYRRSPGGVQNLGLRVSTEPTSKSNRTSRIGVPTAHLQGHSHFLHFLLFLGEAEVRIGLGRPELVAGQDEEDERGSLPEQLVQPLVAEGNRDLQRNASARESPRINSRFKGGNVKHMFRKTAVLQLWSTDPQGDYCNGTAGLRQFGDCSTADR